MRRTWIVLSSAIALAAFVAGDASRALAQEGLICNPVMDARNTAVVDARGNAVVHGGSFECPPPVVEPVAEPAPTPPTAPEPPIVISSDVAFEFDSDRLRPEFHGELDQIAARLNQDPNRRIRVVGHTCNIGSAEYNQGLSERRAESVATYLSQRGVSRNRMTVEGRGLREPVATNETREGRAENRRVEIESL